MVKEKVKNIFGSLMRHDTNNVYKALENKTDDYLRRYEKHCFKGVKCSSFEQYEAVITRWYHTIEKGLAYVDFRPGFGKDNIELLIQAMENYVKDGFDEQSFCFQTALSTLEAYIEKNQKYGVDLTELKNRMSGFNCSHLKTGGITQIDIQDLTSVKDLNYKDFVYSRHSLRHFATIPVDIDTIKDALELAQQTPSACNRQGWHSIVIKNKELIAQVLSNQNGNRGFGNEFDALILIVSDIRYFNVDREIFQPYIDGGMYAQSILNALHFYNIASVPLSASLSQEQEENIRRLLQLSDAELPIMFVGIGNYPNECQTTKSERRSAKIQVL